MSYSAENLPRESFTVALISGTEKVWIRGAGYQDFPSKKPCLTIAEKSVGESFTVALVSGIGKVWRRGGSIKIFRRKFLVSECGNFPLGNPLLLQ